MLIEFFLAFFTILLLFLGIFITFKNQIANFFIHYLSKAMFIYKRNKRPKRIILVRHGQSKANVDVTLYEKLHDSLIGLTDLGKEQARETGKKIKELIKDESIRFFVSPYKRTRQTYNCIFESLKDNSFYTSYDNRLREQEYGNLHLDMDKQFDEQKMCGEFFYRFKDGESGADVFNRGKYLINSLNFIYSFLIFGKSFQGCRTF